MDKITIGEGEFDLTAILRKLSVNDRAQAALYALRRGWVPLQQHDHTSKE